MSYIRFDKQVTPQVPPIGKVSIFVDSVDSEIATIDENGFVSKFLSSVASVNGFTGVVVLDTDNILEGVTNLYYTDTRVDARITLQKSAINGIATLDGSGMIPTSQIPAIAITQTTVVASEVAQLALTAQEGDVAIRSDISESFLHNGGTSGTIADWTMLLTPASSVLSVNGLTGVVSVTTTDVAEGTNLYYTTGRFNTDFSATDTDSLSGGVINLYYTQGRFDTSFSGKSTTDLSEGINLYYTQGRFNTAFSNKTTDDLTEGVVNFYSKWDDNGSGIDYSGGNVGINTTTPNTSLDVQGGMTINVTQVNTATYSLLNTDYVLNVNYTATGQATITLPTAQLVSGRIIEIKDSGFNASDNNIFILTEGAELIENDTDAKISGDGSSLTLYSDGLAWFVY